MKQHDTSPRQAESRQMKLVFEPGRLNGMSEAERVKTVVMLARILTEAAGIHDEENADDKG